MTCEQTSPSMFYTGECSQEGGCRAPLAVLSTPWLGLVGRALLPTEPWNSRTGAGVLRPGFDSLFPANIKWVADQSEKPALRGRKGGQRGHPGRDA